MRDLVRQEASHASVRDKEEAAQKRLAMPPAKQLEIAERNLAHKEKTASDADKEVERLQQLAVEANRKVELASERAKDRHAELAVRIQELDDARKRITTEPPTEEVPEGFAKMLREL